MKYYRGRNIWEDAYRKQIEREGTAYGEISDYIRRRGK